MKIAGGKLMQSTLIRFTSNRYADSYLRGELYLSSLSTFWDISQGKIPYENNLSAEEIAEIIKNTPTDRQDFSEGVIAQIPRTHISHVFGPMKDYVIHDVRFRLSAYKYCNLLCFFRIDAEDGDNGLLDEDNAAYILREKGINITSDELRDMGAGRAQKLVMDNIESNLLLSSDKIHAVQLPSVDMDDFGDAVIVIKDQDEFEKRIKKAVGSIGGRVIMGDIRYHPMMDRVDPSTMNRHSITVISSEHRNSDEKKINYAADGIFDLSFLDGVKNIYWRGCLDKYDRYAKQKEWRVCWLSDERNYEAMTLSVGSLEDIIDVVETKNIRSYLLTKYRGYYPGIVGTSRRQSSGTCSYKDFKEYMKSIDGLGDFVAEIG